MSVSEIIYEVLDQLNMEYSSLKHQPLVTMEDCVAVEEIWHMPMIKNLFLSNTQRTHFYLLLVHPQKTFKTKDFSKQLGIPRVSFGKPEDMISLLNTCPGHLSVLSLYFDKESKVKLVIDESILDMEEWLVHPCENNQSLKLKRDEVINLFLKTLGRDFEVVHL